MPIEYSNLNNVILKNIKENANQKLNEIRKKESIIVDNIKYKSVALDNITAVMYREEDLLLKTYRNMFNDFSTKDNDIGIAIYKAIFDLLNNIRISTYYPTSCKGGEFFRYFEDTGFLHVDKRRKCIPSPKTIDIYNSIASEVGNKQIKPEDIEISVEVSSDELVT